MTIQYINLLETNSITFEVFMENSSRIKLIKKADEIYNFARKLFNEKRSATLRKASLLYKKATLSLMAEKVEKEANEWDENFN